MKTAVFGLFILLGAWVFVDAFHRGAKVPQPPPLARHPAVYQPRGPELRIDGVALGDPWDATKRAAPVEARDKTLIVGEARGEKLTQGNRLLLRVGQPRRAYREAFPRAPILGPYVIRTGISLEVGGAERIESIRLRYVY